MDFSFDLDNEMPQPIEILIDYHKNFTVMHIQYRGCWWPGDTRCQGINSHGVELVCTEYSISQMRRVNCHEISSVKERWFSLNNGDCYLIKSDLHIETVP